MLGVFCAGLNVPITTCMMAIDLFHGTAAGFFVIVAFISYLTAGHRGRVPRPAHHLAQAPFAYCR